LADSDSNSYVISGLNSIIAIAIQKSIIVIEEDTMALQYETRYIVGNCGVSTGSQALKLK
jgi:hypothetical protein